MGEDLDSFQQQIAAGLTRAFDDEATETQDLEVDSARIVIFSDHHKGTRDGADDFLRCERAYDAALGYYLAEGHRLFTLGDVEELWEQGPEGVLEAYADTLALEAEFHKQGRYERFWGNHDDQWGHPDEVKRLLDPIYPGIAVREALKLRLTDGGEELGLIFLVHGHQGTLESERFSFFSRLVVRYVWRPLQRQFNATATTPATDWDLRQRHEEAMFAWTKSHPAKPIAIAGHTHRPIFGTSRPEKPHDRPLEQVQKELSEAEAAQPPDPDRIAGLRAELEWIEAQGRRGGPPRVQVDPPCYFNTGCCSFPDGDITGLEIADGMIRLVRWPTDDEQPAAKVLVEDDLRHVLAAVRA